MTELNVHLIMASQPLDGTSPDTKLGQIATVCYGEKSKNYARVLKRCIDSGHDSILEHVSFTFRIDGISRVCAQQLTRHRLASYTMLSQRYTKDGPNMGYIMPESVENYTEGNGAMAVFFGLAKELYEDMLSEGIKPEDARYILPQSIKTSLYMTVNLRELRHILKLRLDKHAQSEIRLVASYMFAEVYARWPQMLQGAPEGMVLAILRESEGEEANL